MVNKAEQPESTSDNGNTTTDITEEFNSVDTAPEGTTDTPQVDTTTDQVTETPESTESQSTPPAAVNDTPTETSDSIPTETRPPDDLEKRINEIEQQNMEYRVQQQQAQLHQATIQYQSTLESQGYLPEQAKQIADNWAATQNEVSKIQQESQQQARFLQGQANAAEHFAKQYDLQLADLSELRKYPDPESMEGAAKRMKADRDKDKRIAELEAKLVPSQSFDDSQSTPAASNDEGRWLEKYNQGDRSPQASAAARRAAGLG